MLDTKPEASAVVYDPNNWYLLQRLEVLESEYRPNVFDGGGLKKVRADYMGSAEFEWGGVGSALRRLVVLRLQKKLVKTLITVNEYTPYVRERELLGTYRMWLLHSSEVKVDPDRPLELSSHKEWIGLDLKQDGKWRYHAWLPIQPDPNKFGLNQPGMMLVREDNPKFLASIVEFLDAKIPDMGRLDPHLKDLMPHLHNQFTLVYKGKYLEGAGPFDTMAEAQTARDNWPDAKLRKFITIRPIRTREERYAGQLLPTASFPD